jgi:hypothetical protein
MSWGNLPVPPDPLHWSASRDRRYTPEMSPELNRNELFQYPFRDV